MLSEAQGVSLQITSSVRELYTTFSTLAGKLWWRGRSSVFDLNKSGLCPSFVEVLTTKVLGPSRGGFLYWMDDPNITMGEYIRLEEEKARRCAITLTNEISSEKTLSCEPTVSSLTNEGDFRISFDDSDDEDHTPTVIYFDDLDFFNDFENEFPAIVYNDALTSKSDLLTESTLCPQHIDDFYLKDETSLSEYDEKEQNVLYFNDLFPFNIVQPGDLKSEKDNDDNEIDIIQSLGGIENTNKLLEESHDKINKVFIMKSLVMELNVNIMTWNHFVNGMLFNLIKNLYVPFGILFDPKRYYKDGDCAKMLRRLSYEYAYTNADIADFKERLGRIYSREIHWVQVVDFQEPVEIVWTDFHQEPSISGISLKRHLSKGDVHHQELPNSLRKSATSSKKEMRHYTKLGNGIITFCINAPLMTSITIRRPWPTTPQSGMKGHNRNIDSSSNSKGIAAIMNKLEKLGRDMKKLKENVHAIQVGCQTCEGAHLDKDCPLKRRSKRNGRKLNMENSVDLSQITDMTEASKIQASARRMVKKKFDQSTKPVEKLTTKLIKGLEESKTLPNEGFFDNEEQETDDSRMAEAVAALEATLKKKREEPKKVKPNDIRMPIILGRPLLATAHAQVDIFRKTISLEVGSEKVIFKMRSSFTTTNVEFIRSIKSETFVEDDNLKEIDYDLFIYDSESCEFNRILGRPEECEEDKTNTILGVIHDKLNDDWFNNTSEDEDDFEGLLDYLKPKSYDGFINLDDEAYNMRRCKLLGMTYEEPTPILIEKAKKKSWSPTDVLDWSRVEDYPGKGDLHLVLRLCYMMMAHSIAGRSQAPEKGMPELMRDALYDRILMEHREDGKAVVFTSRAWRRLFDTRGPLFVARLAEHFGLLTKERLQGLTVIMRELLVIDMAELPDAAAGAPGGAKDASTVDEGDQAVSAPIRRALAEQREVIGAMVRDFSRFIVWAASGIAQLLDSARVTYTPYSETHVPYQRCVRRRTDGASTSAAQQDQQQPDP
ncbi:hypothetical protein Tco_0840777 [Tanacetum coccineum]|uniref:Uncharacterized protein n=1 Tax=Tanacetum coccineum TaxID=301880 RepID=A0ABQ5AUW9_9ASTR